MEKLAICLSVLGCMTCLAEGYMTGAPREACVSMTPNHGYYPRAQNSYPPYSIYLNASSYTPGGSPIKVSVSGNSLKGLLLQARKTVSWDKKPVGWFRSWGQPLGTKATECSNYADSMTHMNNLTKYTPLEFIWNPPSDSKGNIYFIATVVQSKSVFWTGVNSTEIWADMSMNNNYWNSAVTSGYNWKDYYTGGAATGAVSLLTVALGTLAWFLTK